MLNLPTGTIGEETDHNLRASQQTITSEDRILLSGPSAWSNRRRHSTRRLGDRHPGLSPSRKDVLDRRASQCLDDPGRYGTGRYFEHFRRQDIRLCVCPFFRCCIYRRNGRGPRSLCSQTYASFPSGDRCREGWRQLVIITQIIHELRWSWWAYTTQNLFVIDELLCLQSYWIGPRQYVSVFSILIEIWVNVSIQEDFAPHCQYSWIMWNE